MRRLQAAGVISAPVSDGRDLVEDPHLNARGFWADLDHPDAGRKRYPGNPIKLSETPLTYRFAAPCLGEHNDEVLRGLLGMADSEVAALRADGVVVEQPPDPPE